MIAHHVSAHHMTSHCITWHDTTQAITSHQITRGHITSHRIASKQVTSPPWNSRRLVHSKDMVWASRWSVALRTFYRQILSLLYSSFFFWNFRPRLARELLVRFLNNKLLKELSGQFGRQIYQQPTEVQQWSGHSVRSQTSAEMKLWGYVSSVQNPWYMLC